MNAWLQIDGGADGFRTIFCRPGSPALPAASGARILPRLSGLTEMRRGLSVPGLSAAPAASMTATLDNIDGEITRRLADAGSLRQRAEVHSAAGRLFAGIVTGISLGETAQLDIVAGLDRPLSDKMPLRTSTAWGGWRDVKPIPWGYGRITLTPMQYGAEQRVFVLLDHPAAGVDSVKRDDIETPAWRFWNGLDSTGRAVAFIELETPLSAGERLAVTLRGRMNDAGRLIDSPAEILYDIMRNLAGLDVAWADLDDYRAETAGIEMGGLIADDAASIRAALDQLLMSTGSAWSAAMQGIAHLWPAAADAIAPASPVTPGNATAPAASCRHDDIHTVLRVLYDYDHAAGRAARAIQLEAPASIREYGRIELEWDAGWLKSPRHAEALGRRILAAIARPRWRVEWQQPLAALAPGDWVQIDHPQLPVAGRHRLIEAEVDIAGVSLSCTVDAAVGNAPKIITGALSAAFDPLIQAGITVEIAGSEIIFTARGDDGQPLPGAKITLNGGISRIADNAGRVSFPVQRGRHVLLIEAQGYPPSESIITL